MKSTKDIYKMLDRFIMSGAWESLSNQQVVAVEIPESKEMYYVTVDIKNLEESIFNIDLVKGNRGLASLREAFDPKVNPMDKVRRSDFINISFQNTKKSLPEAYFDAFDKDYVYESFDNIGFPFIYYKAEGCISRPLDETLRSDVAIVFEALGSQDYGAMKKTKISEKTKIKTFYKKEDAWQLEKRIHQLTYPKVKYSDLEIYPLLKQSEKTNETWYMISIYDYMIADEGKGQANLKAPAFKGTVYLLDSREDILTHKDFVGSSEEIPAMKKAFRDALKDYSLRPTTVITNLRGLYYAFKGFMKALDIEFIYEPLDETIKDFSEYIFEDEIKDEENSLENILTKMTLVYFLKAKGTTPKDIAGISEKEKKALIKEFHEILEEMVEPFETLLQEMKENLDVSSEAVIGEKIKDLFIKAMEDKDNL